MSLYGHEEPFEGQTRPKRQVLSVRQVNDAISEAIDHAFPQTIWVKGEVQRFPHDAAQRKHLYFELQETGGSGAAEYQVAVALMGWDRQRYGLGRYVDGSDPDLQIANKLEVCLECKVDFYAKFGKISLKIVGVDKTFALGKLEAQRRQILAFLAERNLLDKNARLPFPELPLKLGLVTSAESAAHHDFMTGIQASGWAFDVRLQSARMQGEMLQAEVIAAMEKHLHAGVDVIVITRGGGSRADLSWFDQRDLAVAIAECPVPVITAIGHEIDTSIADRVAFQSCKTPTAAAEHLVEIIDTAARRLDDAAEALIILSREKLLAAQRRLEVADRLQSRLESALLRSRLLVQNLAGHLSQRVALQLGHRRDHLMHLGSRLRGGSSKNLMRAEARLQSAGPRLAQSSQRFVASARIDLQNKASRLIREAPRSLGGRSLQLQTLEEKARLLDPARLLARGYSMTTGPDGRCVTSASALAAGDTILTRFAEGQVRSIVQPGGGATTSKKTQAKGTKRGSKQEKSSQKSLFR